MSKRITFVLDGDIIEKLRSIQARKIKKSSRAVSFSSVINETLTKSLSK